MVKQYKVDLKILEFIINYEPVGVVAALFTMEFPLVLAARKISTALSSWLFSICKPDVITPGTVMELVDIINQCGVPPGVVNLLIWRSCQQ